MIMNLIFIFSIILITYTYFGYPLLMMLLTLITGGRRRRKIDTAERTPEVSLLIAAYNEEDVIAGKIENTLTLDYPKDKLKIVIVSDGSTDRTDEITKKYTDQRVELFRVEGRKGKTFCRNEAVKASTSEIIIFTDANSSFNPDAVRKLTHRFNDPSVGLVCGNLRLIGKNGNENLYWRYEKRIKRAEDAFHSITGANGSIYAMRRELYTPLPAGVDDDFIEPLLVYSKGLQAVYETDAVSIEEDIPDRNIMTEFHAKKRVILRGLQSLSHALPLINPFRFPILGFQLFSHKICKWSAPFFLLALLVSNIFVSRNPLTVLIFLAQIAFYFSAFLGLVSGTRILRLPAFFVATNLSVLFAVIEFLSGKRIAAWDKARGG